MPLDSSGELVKKSQSLGISKEEAKSASSFEARIYLTLLEQNRAMEDTNKVIFKKLDDATTLAGAAHSEISGVNARLDTLNGKVANTILRVASIEGKAELEEKLKADAKIFEEGRRKGIWQVPRTLQFWISIFWKYICQPVIGIAASYGGLVAMWHFFKP